ncbi:hypothetical protein [Streptomyces hesseae]|uniref:Secreted protein n=1 Tax=Streptomyces hesseae TaxID=3075519 RepID=A0ABU2STC2_9ACTN|nr:hypothetical protein [Streptomyces sp. DSM 40473]MDT0452181.1 hypothetical protein [Streptomyces sp. DSM 40473]
MRHIRPRLAGLAAAVLAIGSTLTFAGPAHAATCPTSNAVCDYSGLNFVDALEVDHPQVGVCKNIRFQGHSTRNHTTHTLILFQGANCTLPTGVDVPPLTELPADSYHSYLADVT